MQSVLRSIKPYWLYLILIGKKTVEVGKDFPKSFAWNREVYLYCSKDRKSFNRIPKKDREWMRKFLGKIACRFVCGEIVHLDCYFFESADCVENYEEYQSACLSWREINDYAAGKEKLFGWRISKLVIYDTPCELCTFKKPRDYAYQSYRKRNSLFRGITRPPQSWCYVEVRG